MSKVDAARLPSERTPRDPDPILAVCSRCSEAQESDRYSIDDALANQGWAVIADQLICDAHLTCCTNCGDPCLLESDGCVRDGDYHCSECWQTCGECGRWAASER